MRLRFFFLSLLVLRLFTSCDDEWSKEEYELWLEENYAELLAVSESVDCVDAAEWSIVEVGYGICGGPAHYLPIHQSVNTAEFQNRIKAYNRISKTYRDKWYKEVMCCLIYMPPPTGVKCVDGKAELEYNQGCDDSVMIWPDGYASALSDGLSIIDISIEGACLKVEYASGGCDGSMWHLQLIDSGDIAESNPVQRYLRFNFVNTEECDAYITKETSFNIKALKEGYSTVILHVDGWDEALVIE